MRTIVCQKTPTKVKSHTLGEVLATYVIDKVYVIEDIKNLDK